MTRLNVYLPDELAARARAAGLNVSALTRSAVEAELAGLDMDAWLESVAALPPTLASHELAMDALDEARDEFGSRG
jgi:post-segregation antitoxin (ccd killing protein)